MISRNAVPEATVASGARIFLQYNHPFLIRELIFNTPSFKCNLLDWVLGYLLPLTIHFFIQGVIKRRSRTRCGRGLKGVGLPLRQEQGETLYRVWRDPTEIYSQAL
ncbi:hypothetical protein BDV09DRAFT_81979 [Aspergillus tetrazonus]